MSKIAVDDDSLMAVGFSSPTPSVTATGFATVAGKQIVVQGDSAAIHTMGTITHSMGVVPPATTPSPVSPTMVSSKPWFTVNGKAVVVDGDSATCAHNITASGFVLVDASEEDD